jgi:hypothetical protein
MNKEFIPYEQALELKELGFDIPSISGYSYPDSDKLLTQAILYQQAFRWFREKYFLDAEIYLNHELGHKFYHYLILQLVRENIEWKSRNITKFKTYEEAELACLKKLIETLQARGKVGKWFADNADIIIEMNKNERK